MSDFQNWNQILFVPNWTWNLFFNYLCFFSIQFCRHHVNIVFQCTLVSAIEMKITLARDACSRLSVTIRSHDLHADDIEMKIMLARDACSRLSVTIRSHDLHDADDIRETVDEIAIEMKITLTRDACSNSFITIRSHDLHVDDIRGAVDDIASCHEKD